MKETKLAVAVVAYQRPKLLRRLLISLLQQEYSEPYELIVVDNGSNSPLLKQIEDLLPSFPLVPKFVRFQKNLVGPTRLRQAVASTNAEFVLWPGDDDFVEPTYLSVMDGLTQEKDVTMVSSALRVVNLGGKKIKSDIVPPKFSNRQEALASLLVSDVYPLPSSGFRRESIDLSLAPNTRTALDWWLWIQCWLKGRAAVSEGVTVNYTWHKGQEQHHYGTHHFRLDAARMIQEFLASDSFRQEFQLWSKTQRVAFVEAILSSSGFNSGDTRWAPLCQIQLADFVRNLVPSGLALSLFAQAAGQMAHFGEVESLQTFAQDPEILEMSPWTWSRVPITAEWECSCETCREWMRYLQLPRDSSAEIRLRFAPKSRNSGSESHTIQVTGTRLGSTQHFEVELMAEPSMVAARPLLYGISCLVGIAHGFEPVVGFKAKLSSGVDLLRFSSLAWVMKDGLHKLKHFLSSQK